MPPKTAASVVRNGASKPHPKGNDRNGVKEEAAPAPTGPQVKSQIVNVALAPAGKSFLDALRSGKKPAAPAAAAKVAVPSPAAVAAPVAEPEVTAAPAAQKTSPVPEVAKKEPVVAAAPAPEEQQPAPVKEAAPAPVEAAPKQSEPVVEAAPAPAPEPEVAAAPEPVVAAAVPAPAVVQVTDTNFSWADEDIQFQIRQPQYAAEYPTSVLENLARNVSFKTPEDQSTMTSAIESLNRERAAFEQTKRAHEDALKNREMELNSMEASLQARERQLHAGTEALRVDRQQLQTQQTQFQAQQAAAAQAAQAAQQRTSQTQSPAAQVSTSSAQSPQAQQQQPPQVQPPPTRSNMYVGGSGYGVSEWVSDQRNWANEASMGGAPNFDMYQNPYQGNYGPRNYHMPGGHRGGLRGIPPSQQLGGGRVPPMMAPQQPYSRAMPQVGNPRPQQQPGMDFNFRPQQQYNSAQNSGYPQQRPTHW
ncbi:hypothetical protein ABL78_3733 [Leptomonas seymouri]|uniref:Uncharacterized protein n=1 Tax=Leptomonas seymouri TaxID=5684 RepID=A0A0N1IL54_LEPSE|nr:hypothetical protein ABL78_3733 [Leptomonas seymouri]|eukprot:KPI87171.1 hypothetical protein ABL78_3733 [Leptomonas seymouri]